MNQENNNLPALAVSDGGERNIDLAQDPEVIAKAYELYLKATQDPVDIAINLGVSKETVCEWITQGKWRVRRNAIVKELLQSKDDDFKQFLASQRLTTAKRHSDIAKDYEEAIAGFLKDVKDKGGSLNDMQLKRLSEALSACAGVSARAGGLSDASTQTINQDVQASNQGSRQPFLVFNVTPVLPSGRQNNDNREKEEEGRIIEAEEVS